MYTRKKPNMRELSDADKQKLYDDYINLVESIARKYIYKCHTLKLKDLIDEGYRGLLRAGELFDKSKKIKFSTYAVPWIENFIKRAIHDQDKEIKIPASMRSYMSKYMEAMKKLSQELNHEPSIEEIAKKMDVPIKRVKQIKKELTRPMKKLSLDAPHDTPLQDFDQDDSLKDSIVSEQKEVLSEELKSKQDFDNLLRKNLIKLEEKVVRLRVGLDDDKPLDFRKIGKKIGKSHETARKIYLKAIEKLRKALED